MTLDIITADSLSPLRHGFFTRRGGASSGVYAGLNCGTGSTDQREIVQINRARVASATGKQHHGHHADDDQDQETDEQRPPRHATAG